MAFISASRPHFELLAIKTQLLDGVISSNEASRLVTEVLFTDEVLFKATPLTTIWRDFDESIKSQTLLMIDKLTT